MNAAIRTSFLNVCAAVVCLLASSSLATAHDLWLNVDNHSPKAGEKSAVKVVFGHNFPYYDILIKRDSLAAFSCLRPDGQTTEVESTREEKTGERAGALAGEITFDREGTYVITACRKVKGDKEHVASEKYGKSLVVVGKGTENVGKAFGHRIEIIPRKNPTEVKAGETIPVRILFEGQPLSTHVYATYAGYSSESEPFPVAVRSNEKGDADVPISCAGTWMVVSNHKVDFSASLTFEVR
jgi:uncharacterized GH25 family protein